MKLNLQSLINALPKNTDGQPVDSYKYIVEMDFDELEPLTLDSIAREIKNLDAKILGVTANGQVFVGYRR